MSTYDRMDKVMSTYDRMDEVWYIHTVKHYTAQKKSLKYVMWMILIMLSISNYTLLLTV